MIEGSQIDWAGHAHDAAWAMTDSQAFDEAVAAALEFAKKMAIHLSSLQGIMKQAACPLVRTVCTM